MKKIMITVFLLVTLFSSSTIQAQWVQIKGPYGGYVNSFAIAGTKLFAGTEHGVFLSNDNGKSWSAANTGMEGASISSLVLSGTHLLAGAQNMPEVYLSTDEGTTWNMINVGNSSGFILSLIVSGTNIFAGTAYNGVYLSTDNGTEWTAANSGIENTEVTCLAAYGNYLFAGTDGNGIYRSSDNGMSWNSIDLGVANVWALSLAVSDTRLFIGTMSNGMFFSADSGKSWSKVNINFDPSFVSSIAVSGTDIFAGTNNGLFISTNDGTNWNQSNTGLTNSQIQSLFVFSNSEGMTNLLAGTGGGGVFRSTNYGTNWSYASNGLLTVGINTFAVSDSTIYAGTNFGGIFLSTDNGENWTPINSGLEVSGKNISGGAWGNCYINTIGVSGKYLFAGTWGGGVFLSTNNGESWNKADSGLTNYDINAFAFNNEGIFAGTSKGLFLSTNNGSNWNMVDLGIGDNPSVLSLAVFDKNLFVGTNKFGNDMGGVYHSTDDGKTWPTHNNTGPYQSVCNLVVSGNNILAGTYYDGVFISSDNGLNWTPVDIGLTSKSINALYSYNYKLLVGTYNGNNIFLSTNNASNWYEFNAGLTDDIYIYAFESFGNYIFAGTSQGIWKRPVSEMITSVKKNKNMSPRVFSLSQNYPNPFNPTTTITYQTPKSGFVSLKVYDMLGREVETLVNEEKVAGSYGVRFDGENLPSGIYFYKLQAGSYISVKKMILLK